MAAPLPFRIEPLPATFGAVVALALLVATPAHAAGRNGAAFERAMTAGAALYARKDYDGAIAAYSEALAARPGDPVALSWRGHAFLEKGDYAQATAHFDAVLKANPREPNASANACWARALANAELDQALAQCDRALARSRDFRTYDARGFLRLRRGEFDQAITDYDAALRQRPKLASALYGRGAAKIAAGRAEGRADLASAIRIEPGIAETYRRRGVTP